MSDGRNAAERLAAALDAADKMLAEAQAEPSTYLPIPYGPSRLALVVAAVNAVGKWIREDRKLLAWYVEAGAEKVKAKSYGLMSAWASFDREEAHALFAVELAAARWSAFLPSVLSPVSVGNPEEQP